MPKVICASGESLIRLKLDGLMGAQPSLRHPWWRLVIFHDYLGPAVEQSIDSLNLNG
jgi:hypothetical protein